MKTPVLVSSVNVPGSSGSTENLRAFFPRKVVRVDSDFEEAILESGSRYGTTGFTCELYRTDSSSNRDDVIIEMFGSTIEYPSFNKICAILSYLGSDEGSSLLDIPDDGDEMNLIIGYTIINGVRLVLFVEHELKDGVDEEIHLHARRLNRWRNDTPMVLTASS